MNKNFYKIAIIIFFLFILISSCCFPAFEIENKKEKNINLVKSNYDPKIKYIEIELSFSNPEVVKYGEYWIIKVKETNHNRYVLFDLNPGKPVLPVNISIFNLVFGSKILDLNFEYSDPEVINLTGKLAFCKATYDDGRFSSLSIPMDEKIYTGSDPYPHDWVQYHTGGGISNFKHYTYLITRIYPVRYFPEAEQLQFIKNIIVNISYEEPLVSILPDNDVCDLLILAPSKFIDSLEPLVKHKNDFGVRTKLVSLDYIYSQIWQGRDNAEKIKLFIKDAIEDAGIKYVLLVGARNLFSPKWNLPARYSHVIPTDEQEYPEQYFISDLYFADIYDSLGGFSSWDSNNDNIFSTWNETFKEEMDLYPDVYLGRLPCINIIDVKTMVNKIIKYETGKVKDKDWFNNFILVAGDSYNDTEHYNEGELISEKAITLMPSNFNPIKVYARENQDINRKTVNNALRQGASFAYFCGHGSPGSWSTHFPPDGTIWTKGYDVTDMISLFNFEKLPVTIVGGCHNGQFDLTIFNLLNPKASYYTWLPKCWSWCFTSKIGGGSIATISNTGLGTHGDGDLDNNAIPDYLEILDGWLELKIFELYGLGGNDKLGFYHGETLTGYIHKFLGDDTKMDVKMVQQWVLFGDPSLEIGGYN